MKKIIAFSKLYEEDFNVKILNSMEYSLSLCRKFSCINNPKTKNLFIYLHNLRAKYTLKNGETVFAESGSIVFTPIGLEYNVEFFSTTENCFYIGINALFFSPDGEEFIPEGKLAVFNSVGFSYNKNIFSEINALFMSSPICMTAVKSLFYEMLSAVIKSEKNEKYIAKKFDIIKEGIMFIEKNPLEAFSVKSVAALCNVSEVYFRRLFKEYSGVSPKEYIINAKISKAKKYLKYENISIAETASLCGFESETYFSRIFKKKTGISPIKYRERV